MDDFYQTYYIIKDTGDKNDKTSCVTLFVEHNISQG